MTFTAKEIRIILELLEVKLTDCLCSRDPFCNDCAETIKLINKIKADLAKETK